jgi:hypothetical protein
MAWVILIVAGLFEVGWAIDLNGRTIRRNRHGFGHMQKGSWKVIVVRYRLNPAPERGQHSTSRYLWQVVNLMSAIIDPDHAAAKRAFDAMMQMKKIDIAAIEAARRG